MLGSHVLPMALSALSSITKQSSFKQFSFRVPTTFQQSESDGSIILGPAVDLELKNFNDQRKPFTYQAGLECCISHTQKSAGLQTYVSVDIQQVAACLLPRTCLQGPCRILSSYFKILISQLNYT